VTDETLICVECGINLKTGERLETRVADEAAGGSPTGERDRGDGEDGVAPAPAAPDPWPWAERVGAIFPGLFRPLTVVLALVMGAVAAGLALLCLGVVGMAPFTGITAGAVGLIAYAQGVAWLMTGEVSLLSNCLVEFDGNRWFVFFAFLAAPFVLFALGLGLLVELGG
jgi:hypothetical protein